MPELISSKEPFARKEYPCMAAEFVMDGLPEILKDDSTLTEGEKNAIRLAQQNGWRVKKGEKYTRQSLVSDGKMYTFIAITALHKICCKYKWYPED